jgi:type II secretory pathway pseudopilin PulG
MKFKISTNQSGQGLLELIIAIGVISVGLFSVWGLFISNYNGEQEAEARVLAINLSREGLEIVRNIRDSNWLHIENNDTCSYNGVVFSPCNWDSGLVGDGTGIVENLFSDNAYIDYTNVATLDDDLTRLYADPVLGLLSHDDSGDRTLYRRMISIRNICCDDVNGDLQCDSVATDFEIRDSTCLISELKIGLDVESHVRWSLKGKDRNMTTHNTLYNWR